MKENPQRNKLKRKNQTTKTYTVISVCIFLKLWIPT